MTNIVLPQKPYKPDCGDILWKGGEYLTEHPTETHKTHILSDKFPKKILKKDVFQLPLVAIDYHPYSALRKLRINAKGIEESKYICPFMGYTHNGIVPTVLITNKYEEYNSGLMEHLQDRDWFVKMILPSFTPKLSLELEQTILLGLGYTSGTLPMDGSRSLKRAYVHLENDDMLVVYFWEWYNK